MNMRQVSKHFNERGFTLVAAILMMLVLSIMIPLIVTLVRQESRETVKQKRTTTAYHLAEAGVDQALWKLQESIGTWNKAKANTTITNYSGGASSVYTMTFPDGSGGNYSINFTSGPNAGEATILAKGLDASTQELRTIQCVMKEGGAGDFSIQAKQSASFGGSVDVEWGPVIGRTSVSATGLNHPRLYSAGNIIGKDANGSTDPNTDGLQWWSYSQDLPPDPQINFLVYKASAIAYGTSGDADCGAYHKTTSFDFSKCTDTGNKVFYVEGDCNFKPAGGGNYIDGSVICTGNLDIQGSAGAGSPTATVPSAAWKEYANDWAYYKSTFDGGAPATYQDAVNANYNPTGLTKGLSNVLIHGFVYVGGAQGLTGGGNTSVWGSMYTAQNAANNTGNVTIYYDDGVTDGIQITNVIISRKSWKELTNQTWP